MFTTEVVDVLQALPTMTGTCTHFFLVFKYSDLNLSKVFNDLVLGNFKSDFMIILAYNILCAVNFFHSVGLMHRELRPANVLLNNQCEIKLFNYGSARDFDELDKFEESKNESFPISTQ